MSHAEGVVYAADGETVLGHFEYDGTSDFACTAIQPSAEGVRKKWRTPANRAECSCGADPIPVVLHADYGRGLSWCSTACLKCMAITGDTSRFDEERRREIERRGSPFGYEP